MLDHTKKFISDISIRYKIFLSYLIILFGVFGILILVNSIIMTSDISEKTLFSAERALQQTKSFVEYKTLTTKNVLNIVSINDQLQEIFERDAVYYSENLGKWAVDSKNLQKILFYARNTPGVDDITIFFSSSLATLYESDRYINLNKYTSTQWYKTLLNSSNKVQWFTDADFDDSSLSASVIAMKKVSSSNSLTLSNGIIRMAYPRSVFDNLLDQAIITESAMAILINPQQVMSSSSNIDTVTDKSLIDQIVKYVGKQKSKFPQWDSTLINGQKMYIGVASIDSNDWKLILIVPDDDITKSINQSKYKFLLLFMIIVPFTLPLAYLVSASITRRIANLIKRIREVDTSNFDQEIIESSKDEVGILTNNFNYMLLKTSMLLDEKYAMGKEIKSMELKALQAQINPHFLYNTLDQLYWMGVKHSTPMISDLVLELSKFYKLSLSKGKDLVSLQGELEHISAYVKIQNYRFDGSIALKLDIPEEFMAVQIPKITLQPIVENAILHGILETEDEKGTITIHAHSNNGCLEIFVEDDGVGIDPDTLTQLRDKTKEDDDQSGYGLKNIDVRLKLVFGSTYGLSFESALNQGTKVTVTIPL